MLETLSRGFRNAKARLTGVTELTPDNIEDALRDVRMSLLEADVEFKVTKTFLDRVKEKAIGETVKLRAKAGDRALSATPEQHFIRICQEELIELMGPIDTDLDWAKKGPTAIMMVGLQGSGKTTTVGKLARWLERNKKRPMLVAALTHAAVGESVAAGTEVALVRTSEEETYWIAPLPTPTVTMLPIAGDSSPKVWRCTRTPSPKSPPRTRAPCRHGSRWHTAGFGS